MRFIIVTASAATYPDACEKLAEKVNENVKEGYVPSGSMDITYDNQRYMWQASQAMIFQ